MQKIVLRYGILSGVILMSLMAVALVLNSAHNEIVGYTTMVLSFLLVFFGVRKYRDTVGGGAIGFGKAFQVGLLISLITCAMYVIAWEIAYFNFFPHFLDGYNAHVLAKMRAGGASESGPNSDTCEESCSCCSSRIPKLRRRSVTSMITPPSASRRPRARGCAPRASGSAPWSRSPAAAARGRAP